MMTLDRQGILEDDYGLVVILLSGQYAADAYSVNESSKLTTVEPRGQ